MSNLSSHGITVVEEAGAVRYRFPLTFGPPSFLLALAGLIAIMIFAIHLFVSTLREFWDGRNPVWSVLWTIPIVAIAVWAYRFFAESLAYVVLVLVSRVELRLGRVWFFTGLCWGPFRRGDRFPVADFCRLVVCSLISPASAITARRTLRCLLCAETRSGRTVMLLGNKPVECLRDLAADIAARCHIPVSETEVIDEFKAPGISPARSRVEVQEAADGVTVIVHPVGVWRAAPLRFVGGLVYLVAVGVVSAGLVWATLTGRHQFKPGEDWGFAGFMVFHGLVALSFLDDALTRGRQRAVLAVVGGEFVYRVEAFLFTTEKRWACEKISDLRPVLVGQVTGDDKDVGILLRTSDEKMDLFLEGYDPAELLWIATVLRRALGLPVLENST